MKNNITLIAIFQSFISKEEVLAVYKEFNYEETSRKFKGTDLYNFLLLELLTSIKAIDMEKIKLHVAFNVNSNHPQQVKETNANKYDGAIGEEIIDIENIIVEDRAYANYERFDMFNAKKQFFVIRIKNNAKFLNRKSLNIKTLFGTTENAVYNQLFIALIAYVLLKFLHNEIIKNLRFKKLSFAKFFRKFLNLEIEGALLIFISLILKKIHLQKEIQFL